MAMVEQALRAEDRIHLWASGKAGMCILGAPVGQLLLTRERLLFLSAGTSGVPRRVAATLALGVVGHALFGKTPTEALDLSALANEGSQAIPLVDLLEVDVGRRLEVTSYLRVRFLLPDRTEFEVSFAPEFGWRKGEAETWASAIDQARASAGLLPAPS
jgi:hypothetical protein